MTQEHKEFLIKDLCARLHYEVKLSYRCNHIHILKAIHKSGLIVIGDAITNVTTTTDIEEIKPYLFPISSMTEEQKNEFKLLFDLNYASAYCQEIQIAANMIKWLNKNHFDIYGLIPMGLANDATGLNIY